MSRLRVSRLRRPTLVVGLLAVLLGGAFLLLFERVEEEIETGPLGAARGNPLLAAERLLSRLGVPAASVRGPLRLPPTDHALLLLTSRRTLGPARAQRLLDWVDAGGHLILTPRAAAAEEADPLLAPLGVEVQRPDAKGTEVVSLRAAPGAGEHRVALPRGPRLAPGSTPPGYAAGPEDAAVLLRYRRQQGWITVLADAGALRNDQLGEHQHAAFLWSLATAPGRPAGAWLVYRDQPPSLGVLLARRAWMVLASTALLLAVWLWRRGARFGPMLRPPEAGRRSLGEHLEASGRFLWERGETETLVEGTRQALLRQAERRHPGWGELPEARRVKLLAELSGVPGGVLDGALHHPVDDTPDRLTRVVTTLEKVRRSL